MMGDMADFANEWQEETVEQRDHYKRGEMTLSDAYENGIVDEMGSELQRTTLKTCRCCNKGGLTWGSSNGKWVLFEGNTIHNCPINKLKI